MRSTIIKGIFITGTDTGVGKTVITGALTLLLNEAGIDAGVMKPVASGCTLIDGRIASEDALFLKETSKIKDEIGLITPYALKKPIAPMSAANIEEVTIDFDKIGACYKRLAERHELVLVEGIGGLMVPLNKTQVVADLVKYLNLPLLIVAGSKLGAINHTLLTVRYAEVLGIEVIGIIVNHPERISNNIRLSNREEIEAFTNIPIWGEIPYCKEKKELLDTVKKNLKAYVTTSIKRLI
ncbi:MAG: dethiobiotin synthase [Thermodesulfobacteriota bacterium]